MAFRSFLSCSVFGLGLLAATAPAQACTSLLYTDANGKVYQGRTMELTGNLPYQLAYFPAGQQFESDLGDGHPPLTYRSRYAMFGITMPDVAPDGSEQPTLEDLKLLDGQNEAGLSFGILAYPTAAGPQVQIEMTRAVLDAIDLGTWALGQFATVAEVKAALAEQPLVLAPVRALRGAEPPFHYILYDRSGASIVIEFEGGQETVYDNPVGVMTNGPPFSWHLTNLGNYSHLTNLDRSVGRFGNYEVRQPDSGIATAGLPSSDTSTGRFVRAAFYATYAEKVEDPDRAVRTLAHVMNNFDRPRGVSVDSGGEGDTLTQGLGLEAEAATEYTTWTKLADLERGLYFVRTYEGLNYAMFDLAELATHDGPLVMPLAAVDGMGSDGVGAMLRAGGR